MSPPSTSIPFTPSPSPVDALASARWVLLQLNTKALRLLWEGQEESAMELLQNCSQTAQRLLVKEQEQERQQRQQPHAPTCATPAATTSATTAAATASTPVLTDLALEGILAPIEFTSTPSSERHEFFRHVILIENCDYEPVGTPLSSTATCALLCYNVAVLYQEAGIVRGCLETLGKAQSWYMAAMRFVGRDCHSNSTSTSVPWLLRAALYGNLCRLATLWGDWNAAANCHAGLQSCLTEPHADASPRVQQALQEVVATLPLALTPTCASAA